MDDLHRALARALTGEKRLEKHSRGVLIHRSMEHNRQVARLASAVGITKEAGVSRMVARILRMRADLAEARLENDTLKRQLNERDGA